MKFTLLTTSFLAGLALAAPEMRKRDLATIQTAIGSVSKALDGLGTAVEAVSASDPNSAAGILNANTMAQDALKTATTQVSGTDVLSLNDALTLQQSATGLTTSVNKTISSLVAKKAIFDQLGASPAVAEGLQSQKTASTAFANALVSKVPAIGQSIAQQSVGQISAAIDSGIKAFSVPAAAGAGAGGSNSTGKATGKPADEGSATMPMGEMAM